MAEQHAHQHETQAWADLAPHDVLEALIYELYGPVSTIGTQLDRLTSGAFEDDELTGILRQMREATNSLGRTVVALKRYLGSEAGEVGAGHGAPAE